METITTATPKQAPPANSLIIPATAWFGTQRGVAQPVPLTQYDDTLPVLAVALYLNGQPYTVPDGAAVNVRMDKRDGHYIYNPAYGLSDDRQTVYVAVTLQMTTGAGEYLPILELVVDGDVAGTSVLPMHIAKNPVPEDAVESTDEWKSIQQIAEEVEEAAQVVQDNAESIQYVQENAANITAVAQNEENISAVGESIANVNTVAENLTPIQTAADNIAAIQQAPASASAAAASATLSESWAVGGTGTREGEDTNNAKYWAEQAQQIAQGAMGWYADPQALQSAHPTGQAGNWAIVGSTDTIWVWDTDTNAWLDTSQNVNLSDYYTKAQADARFSDAVAYTITVPTTGWTTGSLTWGGTTYTRKCTVTAADATASPTSVTMAYEGGDYDAYCQVGLIDTRAGSVVLWATQDPTAECQIRVLEVRSNGQS